MKTTQRISKMLITAGAVTLAGMTNSSAEPLNLTDVPLYLQDSVPPAIALSFDNSPKTQKTYLFYVEGYDGRLPNGKDAIASPAVNINYYNPEVIYYPPLFSDGTPYPDSNFNAAWVDGFELRGGTNVSARVDLSRDFKVVTNYNAQNGQQTTYGGNNVTGVRAFYNKYIGTDFPNDVNDNRNFVKVEIPPNQETNFANWYSYYHTRNMLIKSSASRAFGVLDEDFKIAWQSFKNNDGFEIPMMPMRGAHREAFWDWLLNLKAGGGDSLVPAMYRAGELFKTDQPYREDGVGELLECQQNFHVLLTNSYQNGQGNSSALVLSDERGTTLPDGTTYNPAGEAVIYKEASSSESFADVAFNYWAQDLKSNIANGVPRYLGDLTNAAGDEIPLGVGQDPWDNEALYWNPGNDPADWQHMVNFVIGLGVQGTLDFPEDYRDLRTNGDWPNLGGNDSDEEIDDMWHGALNSRGEFFSVKNPNELTEAFLALIEKLKTRRSGSSSVSSISSNIITENTTLYRTSFDATDWSGSVVAQSLNSDGSIGDVLWDAACLLTGGPCGTFGGAVVQQTQTFDQRKIFAYDQTNGQANPFNAASLSPNQLLQLSQSPLIQNGEATLIQLVNYLRGDQSQEEKNGGVFRNRRVILGDVIHSSAKVVRGPSESYSDDAFPRDSNIVASDKPYKDFKVQYAERRNLLLVGANDGMLHAFDANTGKEMWAYIPSLAFKNLHKLASPDYEHQNFVDLTPVVRDVFINGNWKTVAIGGLRLGGQGYYALDITNPTAPRVLWEFTEFNDGDMGYSYSEPFITRLNNDKWVALLPNGYNSVVRDGRAGSGDSVLFMVDMETGGVLKKFRTGEGNFDRSNGMAGAVVSDVPYDITGDAVFVGDLRGDVYRIDLTDPGFPFEKMIDTVNPYETPITTPLRLTQYQNFSNSPTDIMVHLGTGKFIEVNDRTEQLEQKQFVAGIFDQGAASSTYPISLMNERVIEQVITSEDNIRTLTNTPVSKSNHLGWRVELPGDGERVVSKMATRASAHILVYSTYLPRAGSGCATGGASWVMAADNRTGGQPYAGSLLNDGNADGVYIEDQVFGITPIGYAGGGGEILIISTDDPGGDCSGEEDCSSISVTIPDFTWRRRSWNRVEY
ncbi:pilus assembly protein [Marinicella sediminis]|uniref:Pilus assembly protein n=1 Tax=Marinicella sediminis TaxID=1792834 RepID=A0ABV7JFP2_9GAMM|nr:PilC/PilY family type IV pilus protein [Marinicella sediminis]